ncbi:transcription factor grauzone-like isoform X2 [Topomyia yanbarensis]|nr:transcription factor grauzone-like isoform X2 [Topomyia yanbarensis]
MSVELNRDGLVMQLELLFNQSFEINSLLPKIVCHECVELVDQITKFSRKVRKNQEYLNSLEVSKECNETKKLDSNDEPAVNTIRNHDDKYAGESENTRDENEYGDIRQSPRKTRKSLAKSKRKVDRGNRTKEDELIQKYYKFQCDICATDMATYAELLIHFREHHNTSGYIKCCNKKLFRRCRLLDHISKHLDPGTFHCAICDRNYSCKDSLELHNMHQHLTEDKKPFKCSKCSKSFAKDYQLTCHMVLHVKVECPECGKILSNRITLKDHMSKMHIDPDQKRLVCDTCGKEFRSKQPFQRHVLLHKGIDQNSRQQCQLCKRWFVNKLGLKQHIKSQHTEAGESFVCGVCGKVSPNKYALQQHQRVVHPAQQYACEFCEKKFKRAISLKEHRATHNGAPLYSCKFCPQTFFSNANMYTHQKRMHASQWEQSKQLNS